MRGSRTISPKKKRKREELSDKTASTPSSNENTCIVKRAARLKRRVCFLIIFKPSKEVRSLIFTLLWTKPLKDHNTVITYQVLALSKYCILYVLVLCCIRHSATWLDQLYTCTILDKSLGTELHFWCFCAHTRCEYNFICLTSPPTSYTKLCWKLVLLVSPDFQHCIGWGGGVAMCF